MAEEPGDDSNRSNGRVSIMQWKDSDIKAAMEAVSSEEMTVTASSRVFKVPRKTLDGRIKGRRGKNGEGVAQSWKGMWSRAWKGEKRQATTQDSR